MAVLEERFGEERAARLARREAERPPAQREAVADYSENPPLSEPRHSPAREADDLRAEAYADAAQARDAADLTNALYRLGLTTRRDLARAIDERERASKKVRENLPFGGRLAADIASALNRRKDAEDDGQPRRRVPDRNKRRDRDRRGEGWSGKSVLWSLEVWA